MELPSFKLSWTSDQAALDVMTLYAYVDGVGTCLWGAGLATLNRNRTARRALGLGRREHMLGALLLGYPAVRFSNRVEGRLWDVDWV